MDISDFEKIFEYNEDTGLIYWKYDRSGKAKAGTVAGGKSKSGNKFYRSFQFQGKKTFAHRIIASVYLGMTENQKVDHINGDGTDNRLINLRVVCDQENNRNSRLQARNKTGVTGIKFVPSGRYGAFVIVDKKFIWLGTFDDFLDAVSARKKSELHYGFHENHGKSNR